MIAQWQIEQFHQQGFLVVEGVLSPDEIAALQQDFDGWVEESRRHTEVWGETLDGRPRFDLEGDHRADHPRCAGSVRRRRFPSPSNMPPCNRVWRPSPPS